MPVIGETVTLEIDSKRSLCLTLVGVRWSVERRTIFLTPGAETGRLHAARLRIANLGDAVVAAEPASVTIVTAAGRQVDGDLLVDLTALQPGEALEGWVVFEVGGGDAPETLSYRHHAGASAAWSFGPGHPPL